MIGARQICKFKEGCDNPPQIGAGGFCGKHKELDPLFEYKTKNAERKVAAKKIQAKVRSITPPRPAISATDDFQQLQNWFSYVGREIGKHPYCMECGAYISPTWYRASSAHILPKKIFESVKTHKMNFVVLCGKNGCHNRSHRLDTFSKMKVFPEAVRRFSMFASDVQEKNKLLNDFIEYAMPYL